MHSGLSVPPIVREVLRSPGQPLDSATLALMESRFGHSFSQVRVHDNATAAKSARAVSALAYTVARHIVFAADRYAPYTHEGRLLLAHELTHVVQQGGAPAAGRLEVASSQNALERQADEKAQAIMAAQKPGTLALSAAPFSLQRSCGPAAIGKPMGCIGVEGDVLGEPFLFQVGCDDFRTPLEESRLKSFAATLSAGDFIAIHGFASIEGDPTFNDNLSCARAITARGVIEAANAAPMTIQLFMHGATAGDRDERRCVIIERTPAPPEDRPAPKPPGPEQPSDKNNVCGPDVTDPVKTVLDAMESYFTGPSFSHDDKVSHCEALHSLRYGLYAWDINPLYWGNAGWLDELTKAGTCDLPGDGKTNDDEPATNCKHSVRDHEKCVLAGTLNYFTWGQMHRLCHNYAISSANKAAGNPLDPVDWDKPEMGTYIKRYKFFSSESPSVPIAFAEAAFDSGSGAIPPVESRAQCTGVCTVAKSPPGGWTWTWEPGHVQKS